MMIYRLALAAILLFAVPVSAADIQGKFVVRGQGVTSCGSWVTDRKGDNWYPEAAWINGYLTAYNFFIWKKSSDVAATTDADGIMAWMDGYCTAHPLDSISDGSDRLVTVLGVRSFGGSLTNEYGP